MSPSQARTASGWYLAVVAAFVALKHRRSRAGQAAAVARAVHELRGPLTAVRLAIHPATCGLGIGPGRAHAIELELDRAALVLRDLANVKHQVPGSAPLELVDLQELLASCVESWSAFASARGATLRLEGPAEPAPMILGQPLRLLQAVGNLIANAVEHGGGAVRLDCRCEDAVVRVAVSDGGPGLPGPVSKLLDDSARQPGTMTMRSLVAALKGGCYGDSRRGHGLAVAAEVARTHSGRMSAAPAARGARLVLELPRADWAGDVGRLTGT